MDAAINAAAMPMICRSCDTVFLGSCPMIEFLALRPCPDWVVYVLIRKPGRTRTLCVPIASVWPHRRACLEQSRKVFADYFPLRAHNGRMNSRALHLVTICQVCPRSNMSDIRPVYTTKAPPYPPSIFSNLADYFRFFVHGNGRFLSNTHRINNFQSHSARISALVDAVEIG